MQKKDCFMKKKNNKKEYRKDIKKEKYVGEFFMNENYREFKETKTK